MGRPVYPDSLLLSRPDRPCQVCAGILYYPRSKYQCVTCARRLGHKGRKADARLMMLASAKYRARRDGRLFDLTVDDIVIPEFCPYLGVRLVRGLTLPGPNSLTLDCIIPALGYVKGNILVISQRANRIKNDGTWQDLMAIAIKLKELTE